MFSEVILRYLSFAENRCFGNIGSKLLVRRLFETLFTGSHTLSLPQSAHRAAAADYSLRRSEAKLFRIEFSDLHVSKEDSVEGECALIGVVSVRPMVAMLARYASKFSVRAIDLNIDSSLLWVGAALAIVAAVTGIAFLVTNPVEVNQSAPQARQADSDDSGNRESSPGRMDTNLSALE